MKKRIQLHTIIMTLFSSVILFFIVTSFLYYLDIVTQLILSVVFTIPVFLFTKNRILDKYQKRRFYVRFTGILLFIFTILFIVDLQHQTRTDRVPYIMVWEEEYSTGQEKFWYSDHYILRDDYNIVMYFNGRYNDENPEFTYDGIYAYDLDAELNEIETFIDTNGLVVRSVSLVEDTTTYGFDYYLLVYGHRIDTEGNYTTEIGKIDISDYYFDENFNYEYEMITQVEGRYTVGLGQEDIVLVEAYIPNLRELQTYDPRVLYKLNEENELEYFHSYANALEDIWYLRGIGWYFIFDGNDVQGRYLKYYNDEFTESDVIINGLYDYPDEIHTGFDVVIVNVEGPDQIIDLATNDVTEFEQNMHFTGENIYLSGEQEVYNIYLEKISRYFWADRDTGELGSAGRAFVHRNGLIAMDEEHIYQLNEWPYDYGLFIKGPFRYVVLIVALLLLPLFINLGFKHPPRPKTKSHIYQVKKLTCAKCGAHNNVVTFPDKCDYCGSYQFK